VDPLGNPLAGKGPVEPREDQREIDIVAPGIVKRQQVEEPIQTGEIYARYDELGEAYNEDTISKRRLSDYLKHLELLELITVKYHYGGRKGKTRQVRLNELQ
jgi:Cdc6-like AAA superfamily ATPase